MVRIEHGEIKSTDYFDSADFRRGQAWAIALGDWHLLIPLMAINASHAEASPVPEDAEESGWLWQIQFGEHCLRLPARCWTPAPPMPPEPTATLRRRLIIYRSYRDPKEGTGHFGAVPIGMSVAANLRLVIRRSRS